MISAHYFTFSVTTESIVGVCGFFAPTLCPLLWGFAVVKGLVTLAVQLALCVA